MIKCPYCSSPLVRELIRFNKSLSGFKDQQKEFFCFGCEKRFTESSKDFKKDETMKWPDI